MKKILFPTDFSEVANNAFVHALELAKIIDGEIILLHTFDYPIVDNQFFQDSYQNLFETLELSNFEKFRDCLPALRTIAEKINLGHIKLSHRLMDGGLQQNINECVKLDSIDFVVMGTSGATGWKEFFIGSNTGEVITSVEVPVLCVPINAQYNKIETIGFTTRYRDKDKIALKKVIDLAQKTNSKVKCLYVQTKQSDNNTSVFNDWEEQFKQDSVQFFNLPSDDVKETINEFIASQEIDILAMLTYKRGFFESLFNSSFAEKFSFDTSIPIIVFHE